jgi:hypothetical protein
MMRIPLTPALFGKINALEQSTLKRMRPKAEP